MTEHFDLTAKRLRHVLGHFASGLTVITAATDNGPAGFTWTASSMRSTTAAITPSWWGRYVPSVPGTGQSRFSS